MYIALFTIYIIYVAYKNMNRFTVAESYESGPQNCWLTSSAKGEKNDFRALTYNFGTIAIFATHGVIFFF